MADSLRLTVIKRLQKLLGEITPANRFHVDLQGKVFAGRTIFGAEIKPPYITILEGLNPVQGLLAGVNGSDRSTPWPLIIQGWAVDDKANPSYEAYDLMAQVEQQLSKTWAVDNQGNAVYPDYYMLGSRDEGGHLVADIRLMPGIVSPPRENVSATTFFFLPIYITMAEKIGKPYC